LHLILDRHRGADFDLAHLHRRGCAATVEHFHLQRFVVQDRIARYAALHDVGDTL